MNALFALLLLASVANAARDYYEVLGVESEASIKDIKSAYRKLSLQYHPDKNPDDPSANEKFQEISRAYEILSSDEKRQVYDYEGFEGLEALEKQGAAGNQPVNPLEALFGGGGGQRGRPKGPEAQMTIDVTLEELYSGTTKPINLNRNVICKKCRGTGAEGGETTKCKACKGQGFTMVNRQMGPGFTVQMQQPCAKCDGKGVTFKKVCPFCKGNKVTMETKELQVIVERGMKGDDQIRFERQSEQRPGMTPGDVVFILRQSAHPVFTRQGNDLKTTLRISLSEALLGFSRTIVHLDGHTVSVRGEGITIPFQVKTIKGQGMPIRDFPSEAGNLLVEFLVEFPSSLSDKQKEQVKALLG